MRGDDRSVVSICGVQSPSATFDVVALTATDQKTNTGAVTGTVVPLEYPSFRPPMDPPPNKCKGSKEVWLYFMEKASRRIPIVVIAGFINH